MILSGNDPVTGGLFDPRMGVLEYGLIYVMYETNKETPGYFGHIELALPVFHVNIFQCTENCKIIVMTSTVLYSENTNHIDDRSKLNYLIEQSKKSKFAHIVKLISLISMLRQTCVK